MAEFVVPPANITLPGVPFDACAQARVMYWMGWDLVDIARAMDIPASTVKSWKQRQKWDEAEPIQRASECTYVQYIRKVMKAEYTSADVRDIDLLGRQVERMARVRRFQEPGGHEGHLNEKVANRNAKPKKKPEANNLISGETVERLEAALKRGMYAFQQDWWDSQDERTRAILKSRQIGATFHFARERLIRALRTGNNQIFISASRNQAAIFKQYIIEFVQGETGIKLTGDPIVIQRGEDADGQMLEPVSLYFLGTNYRTAQGYHGDVIIDEAFWIYGFDQIFKVASAMATQKRYTITLFSTPSTINHEAYAIWSGERFNRRRPKEQRVKIDISHRALKDGLRGPDRIWRQIVTLNDAIARGYDLIDADDLALEYSVEEFKNLFLCEFIDDSESSFPHALVSPAMVDAFYVWRDFNAFAARPYDGEVWIGYDPNDNDGQGDPAGLVVVAAPRDRKDKFRVLERHRLIGLDYEGQAKVIKDLKRKYHVTEIAIDTKGVGNAVWQLVVKFHPTARKIDYSVVIKGLMVQKAQNVFRNRRIEMDAGMTDVAAALMSIHPHATGNMITFKSRRSAELGHGDVGWALLNALYCEPMEVVESGGQKRSSVVISDD